MQRFEIDGFPVSDDPIQSALAADLQSAHELRKTGAAGSEMFPRYWAAVTDRSQWRSWFGAALERLDWHLRRADQPAGDEESWPGYLTQMLSSGLWTAQLPLDAGTLTLFLRHAERIDPSSYEAPALAAKAIAADPSVLSSETAELLRPWVSHLVRIHAHHDATFQLAFQLYRSGYIEIPWASPELVTLKPLLDLADHNWLSASVQPLRAKKLSAAIAQLGVPCVWAGIDDSIERLESIQPSIALSGAGMTLLRQILQWLSVCDFNGNNSRAVHRIAQLRWSRDEVTQMLMKEWLGSLMECVSKLPATQALACAEMLAHNPDTNEFVEVTTLHQQLMAEALSNVPGAASRAVDGFENQSGMHSVVSSMLDSSVPAARDPLHQRTVPNGSGAGNNVAVAFRQGQCDVSALLDAMSERVRWLADRAPKPSLYLEPPWIFWNRDLASLYHRVLEAKPALNRAQLMELCRIDAMNWLCSSITGQLIDLCTRHIDEHGYHPELSAAMREWGKSVHGGGATVQAMRKQIDKLLWFDPEMPLKEKDCWSVRVRLDLRKEAARRAAWMAALRNTPGTFASFAPTKKWLKPAEKLLRAIGPEDFRTRVRLWFDPFRGGKVPLKITTVGRDVIGALFWYSLLADKHDQELNEALTWFGQAKWKSKADAGRIAMLVPVWIHVMAERLPPNVAIDAIHSFRDTGQLALFDKSVGLYKDICARVGRTPEIEPPPPGPPVDLEAIQAKWMDKAFAIVGGPGVTLDGEDTISVTHAETGDQYQISRKDGRMVRLSDGRPVRLEIDWSVPPFSPFKQMADSADIADPFKPNYFRLMLCTQILSGSLGIEVPIVADEDDLA
jgi:hypothetical protein